MWFFTNRSWCYQSFVREGDKGSPTMMSLPDLENIGLSFEKKHFFFFSVKLFIQSKWWLFVNNWLQVPRWNCFVNSLTQHSCMWLTSVISKACEKRRFYAIAAASRSADGVEGRATGTMSTGRDVSSGCVLLFLYKWENIELFWLCFKNIYFLEVKTDGC